MGQVLLLNHNYIPIEAVSWERAIVLLLEEKVYMVSEYVDRQIRSASQVFPYPAVLVWKKDVSNKRKIKFSRKNIIARDGYRCQYCGSRPLKASGKPDLRILTIDHVVPRAQSIAGQVRLPWNKKVVPVTCWENVLTACESCNTYKAARTPGQAGMRMKRKPRVPSVMDSLWMSFFAAEIPDEWKEFLPDNNPWRNYWDGELALD